MAASQIAPTKDVDTPPGLVLKAGPDSNVDPRHKALAVALEFTKRLFEVRNLDDLYFVLTNDIRALIDFDRAFLILHLDDESKVVSVGNQPLLEINTKFYETANKLAAEVRNLKRGLFLAGKVRYGDRSGRTHTTKCAGCVVELYRVFGVLLYLLRAFNQPGLANRASHTGILHCYS